MRLAFQWDAPNVAAVGVCFDNERETIEQQRLCLVV